MPAFVILRTGVMPSVDVKKDIAGHVRKILGPIAVIQGVEFVNTLPKTRSGKIMRRVLRKVWTGEELGDLSTLELEASIEEVKEAVSRLRPNL